MIIFLHILSVVAAFTLSGTWAVYAPCVIPLAYILVMAPGTFSGGSDISLGKLQQQLSERWSNADELAAYYYFKLNIEIPAYILMLSSVVLYAMATRVNRPLSIYKDPKFRTSLDNRFRNEWRLATISMVAFSELFPDSGKHKYLAEIIQSDEIAREILKNWRR